MAFMSSSEYFEGERSKLRVCGWFGVNWGINKYFKQWFKKLKVTGKRTRRTMHFWRSSSFELEPRTVPLTGHFVPHLQSICSSQISDFLLFSCYRTNAAWLQVNPAKSSLSTWVQSSSSFMVVVCVLNTFWRLLGFYDLMKKFKGIAAGEKLSQTPTLYMAVVPVSSESLLLLFLSHSFDQWLHAARPELN